jgi:hypothetical protein
MGAEERGTTLKGLNMDTPFDAAIERLNGNTRVPLGMVGALVHVFDTLDVIKRGFEQLGTTPSASDLLDAFRLVESRRVESLRPSRQGRP